MLIVIPLVNENSAETFFKVIACYFVPVACPPLESLSCWYLCTYYFSIVALKYSIWDVDSGECLRTFQDNTDKYKYISNCYDITSARAVRFNDRWIVSGTYEG